MKKEDIFKFKRLLDKNKANREHNREVKDSSEETYSFELCYKPNHNFMLTAYYIPLIELDEEDLNYFKEKYYDKMIEEEKSEIDARRFIMMKICILYHAT